MNYINQLIANFRKISGIINNNKKKKYWKSASLIIFCSTILYLIIISVHLFSVSGPLYFLGAASGFILLFILFWIFLSILLSIKFLMPKIFRAALTLFFITTVFIGAMSFYILPGYILFCATFLISTSLIGWSAHKIFTTRLVFRKVNIFALTQLFFGVILFSLMMGIFLSDGFSEDRFAEKDGLPLEKITTDPSQKGSYSVKTINYGSGGDKRRTEFSKKIAIHTKRVDGTAFLEGYSFLRKMLWGFDQSQLPLNGRVYYPDGAGPFPLVLIVHGNHDMLDFSDDGYGYLCELLASKGYIAVSVDENFINWSVFADLYVLPGMLTGNSLKDEIDCRAWLLLEHLSLWRNWTANKENLFFKKADMSSICLIGHSRGGEAVAVASLYNRLSYYPDNTKVKFDYNFAIKTLIAIAPSDGLHKPAGRNTELENVDYFVLHGSKDMDVISFMGQSQYNRVTFSGVDNHYKAALYIDGANHGQFNTTWGRYDTAFPWIKFFNTKSIITPEDQRKFAEVYIPSFIELSMKNNKSLIPLFKDYRSAADYLPKIFAVNQYFDNNTSVMYSFEKSFDITKGDVPDAAAEGEDLSIWKLSPVKGKGKFIDFCDNAVMLGWVIDTEKHPSFKISLPISVKKNETSTLVYNLARTEEDPSPATADLNEGNQFEDAPIDYLIEVTDASGNKAEIASGIVRKINPAIKSRVAKFEWFMNPMLPESEPVFQHYELPFTLFKKKNPQLNISSIVSVKFVFDNKTSASILIDDIGISGGKQ